MSARHSQRIGEDHRIEASHDSRDGTVYVRVRRHKRGKPVSFTLAQWAELTRVIRAGDLDWIADLAPRPDLVEQFSDPSLTGRAP